MATKEEIEAWTDRMEDLRDRLRGLLGQVPSQEIAELEADLDMLEQLTRRMIEPDA